MINIQINPHAGVLTLNIDQPLASANMRMLSDRAEADVARSDGLRGMIIAAPQFPAWRELSALFDKLRSLQAYRSALARIAVVTESSPMEFVGPLAGYFPGAEIDRFSAQRMERAEAWVSGAAPGEGDAVVMADEEAPVTVDADPSSMDNTGEVELEALEAGSGSGEEDDWFV